MPRGSGSKSFSWYRSRAASGRSRARVARTRVARGKFSRRPLEPPDAREHQPGASQQYGRLLPRGALADRRGLRREELLAARGVVGGDRRLRPIEDHDVAALRFLGIERAAVRHVDRGETLAEELAKRGRTRRFGVADVKDPLREPVRPRGGVCSLAGACPRNSRECRERHDGERCSGERDPGPGETRMRAPRIRTPRGARIVFRGLRGGAPLRCGAMPDWSSP